MLPQCGAPTLLRLANSSLCAVCNKHAEVLGWGGSWSPSDLSLLYTCLSFLHSLASPSQGSRTEVVRVEAQRLTKLLPTCWGNDGRKLWKIIIFCIQAILFPKEQATGHTVNIPQFITVNIPQFITAAVLSLGWHVSGGITGCCVVWPQAQFQVPMLHFWNRGCPGASWWDLGVWRLSETPWVPYIWFWINLFVIMWSKTSMVLLDFSRPPTFSYRSSCGDHDVQFRKPGV